jgi:hypothetical protein
MAYCIDSDALPAVFQRGRARQPSHTILCGDVPRMPARPAPDEVLTTAPPPLYLSICAISAFM